MNFITRRDVTLGECIGMINKTVNNVEEGEVLLDNVSVDDITEADKVLPYAMRSFRIFDSDLDDVSDDDGVSEYDSNFYDDFDDDSDFYDDSDEYCF